MFIVLASRLSFLVSLVALWFPRVGSFVWPSPRKPFWKSHETHHLGTLRVDTTELMADKGTTDQSPPVERRYPPSRFTVDEEGRKWRLCAGAAVLNSHNFLLIGERINIPGAWQAPQGGVDDAWDGNNNCQESIKEAAVRELYEEMGLRVGQHVVFEEPQPAEMKPFRYNTQGTQSWLSKAGFSGQELHWTIFRIVDSGGDQDPTTICDLSGKNGEGAEFSAVRWCPIESVVDNMWPSKRAPYEALQKAVQHIASMWDKRCALIDFSGVWTRDNLQSEATDEDFLLAPGESKQEFVPNITVSVVEEWKRIPGLLASWSMTRFVDGKEHSTYHFVKTDDGTGLDDESTQTMSFCAEPDADGGLALVVSYSSSDDAQIETRRYRKGVEMLVKRTVWNTREAQVFKTTATERFKREVVVAAK